MLIIHLSFSRWKLAGRVVGDSGVPGAFQRWEFCLCKDGVSDRATLLHGADTAMGIGRTHLCLACTSHSAMSCFISLSSLSPILPSTDPHPQTSLVACASLPSVQRRDDVTLPVRLRPSSFFPFLFARMGGGAHRRCVYVSPLALVPLVFFGRRLRQSSGDRVGVGI